MINAPRRGLIAAATLALWFSQASAEEVVEKSGKTHRGRLHEEKGAWTFRDEKGKSISTEQLSHIRFEGNTTPLPKAPLRWALRLPSQQRVTGNLVRVDDKTVEFITWWGQSVSVRREHLLGIEQATDALPIVHDDFETLSKSWRIEGKATLAGDQHFAGKSSLRFDDVNQSATHEWPAVRDGTVRLFYHSAAMPGLGWTVAALTESPREQPPALAIEATRYLGANLKGTFAPLEATQGWHLLCVEIENAQLRIYVDDHCLGQTTLEAKDGIKGLRVSSTGKEAGKLWIDELLVTRRVPALKRPQSAKDQDMLWLEHGEQLFGRIESANTGSVTFDANFGKRIYEWTKLRGIFFAEEKESPMPAEPEIVFRPGPGFPLDCLRAKLLRWDDAKLIVQHSVLGEIAIERSRLHTIRFAAK